MKIEVLLLMGGLFSADGIVTSTGMIGLQRQIERIPNVEVHRFLWGDFKRYCTDARFAPKKFSKLAVVAFSGGGMSMTYLADQKYCSGVKIDLAILYDPSPSWNMRPIGSNVRRAINYQNSSKMFIPLVGFIGGGKLVAKAGGPRVIIVPIREPHLAVQFDRRLHRRTMQEIRRL